MLSKVIFAGFGGQGVMMMGYALAYAALEEGRKVTFLPSYGVEVRGGSANCTVAVSDDEIASPVASAPEFVVVMNTPALVRFQNQVLSGGALFLNSSLTEEKPIRGDIEIIPVPASKWAEEVGDIRAANFVMLGALSRRAGLVGLKSLENVLKTLFPARKSKLIELNRKSLRKGYEEIVKEGE